MTLQRYGFVDDQAFQTQNTPERPVERYMNYSEFTAFWLATTDGYCERNSADLLAEPLNAVSNLAFLLAALLLTRQLGDAGPQSPSTTRSERFLVIMLWLIGFGSLTFHTFATRWAALLDVLPIAMFIFAYVALALRRFFALPWVLAALGPPVLVGLNVLFARMGAGGASGYLPALVGLIALGLGLHRQHPALSSTLFRAAGVFGASLTLRTLDEPLCDWLPLGTHWAWHLLNALTLFLVTRAFIAGRPTSRPAH